MNESQLKWDSEGVISSITPIERYWATLEDGKGAPADHYIDYADENNRHCSIALPCKAGQVSDGYHTFNELYEHRHTLFCALSRMVNPALCWKSRNHWINDKNYAPVWDGWFVAGMMEQSGEQITYHLPINYWDMFYGKEREIPPLFDGHTSADVLKRLQEWIRT